MSYDVTIYEMDEQGPTGILLDVNYTSNLAGVWTNAGARLSEWDGMRCREFLAQLQIAVETIEGDLPYYRKFNPENGWGDVDSMLVGFLVPILLMAEQNPDAIMRVSY